jgi:hypothetical protein
MSEKSSEPDIQLRFIRAFAEDFEQHGTAVIGRVRSERPQDYLKVAASLMPKQVALETDAGIRLNGNSATSATLN